MTRLAPDLLDTDFQRLSDAGRALIPPYAPAWTDHNAHDPGIMLVELLAWVTESQIYSLARMRSDERHAYAALFGVEAMPARPARGTLWPGETPAAASTVEAGTPALLSRIAPLAYLVTDRVALVPATIGHVERVEANGAITDLDPQRNRSGADFVPFGVEGTATFLLQVVGAMGPGNGAPLSLGVLVDDALPPSAERGSGIEVRLVTPTRSYSLSVTDGTEGFRRSGTLLLTPPPVVVTDGVIRVRLLGRAPAVAPRIVDIGLNVLPVEQLAEGRLTLPALDAPLPDLAIALAPEPAGDLVGPPEVQVDGAAWRAVENFDDEGPDATVFRFDPRARDIRFGNGVNGRLPTSDTGIDIRYRTTRGGAGTVPRGQEWRLGGRLWTNRAAAGGGANATSLDDLARGARHAMRADHPLVTDGDITGAALAFANLGVARAETIAGRGTLRRLVALRTGGTETVPWLAEIARRLRPRLPIGERLVVLAPARVPVTIEAELVARPGAVPEGVREAALAMLGAVFDPLPDGDRPGWTLGKPVRPADLRARLRRLPGVVRVGAVSVSPPDDSPLWTARALPQWTATIRVSRSGQP